MSKINSERQWSTLWIVLRVVVVAAGCQSIFSASASPSNVDWIACAIISLSCGAFIFLYFVILSRVIGVDWSHPLSLTKPFWWPSQYPVRFWCLAAELALLGGVVALARDVISLGRLRPIDMTFFCLGLAFAAALAAAARLSKSSSVTH